MRRHRQRVLDLLRTTAYPPPGNRPIKRWPRMVSGTPGPQAATSPQASRPAHRWPGGARQALALHDVGPAMPAARTRNRIARTGLRARGARPAPAHRHRPARGPRWPAWWRQRRHHDHDASKRRFLAWRARPVTAPTGQATRRVQAGAAHHHALVARHRNVDVDVGIDVIALEHMADHRAAQHRVAVQVLQPRGSAPDAHRCPGAALRASASATAARAAHGSGPRPGAAGCRRDRCRDSAQGRMLTSPRNEATNGSCGLR